MTTSKQDKGAGGFTLVEILVVVIILGIAAVIVIPLMGSTDGMQVSSAARQIASTLQFAQTASISSQQQYQVVFDSGNNRYEVQDATGSVVTDPGASGNSYLIDFPSSSELSGVTIESANFDGSNTVWFDRMGAPYGGTIVDSPPVLTTGSVTVQAGNKQMTVHVEPMTGRISID